MRLMRNDGRIRGRLDMRTRSRARLPRHAGDLGSGKAAHRSLHICLGTSCNEALARQHNRPTGRRDVTAITTDRLDISSFHT